jgi:ribonuclease E
MLDNEPDTNPTTPEQPAEAAPPARRRRRAASRPAGPPSTAPDAPPIEHVAVEPVPGPATEPEPPATAAVAEPAVTAEPVVTAEPAATAEPTEAAESPASPPPAKRAARKRAAPAEGTERPARAPRKRVAKKAVPAAEESADEILAPTTVDLTESSPAVELPAPAPSEIADPAPAAVEEVVTVEPAEPQGGGETVPLLVGDAVLLAPTVLETTEPEAQAVEPEIDDADAAAATGAEPDLTGTDVTGTDVAEPEVAASDPADAGEPEPAVDEESDDEADAEEESDGTETGGRRRRRRRGGRRRRRSGGDDEAGTESDSDDGEGSTTDPEDSAEDGSDADDTGEDSEGEGGTRRRRRRRRRRGEDAGASADDPTEVVVRVREPRRSKASSEVTGIDGSTRMEAKRQRRREGREAGRRRAPILSEAEFLARREAVARKMIIRQRDDLSQIAVLEDDILVEHYVDRDSATSLIGNVYLGRVQNVLPSMEAAFIDIGRGRNAVLYAGEVDWDSFGAEGQNRKVEKVLKSGQTVLVQVTKDPVGAKGARLTNHVSIPGRYIVYAPGGHLSGISRKLPDIERRRLKDILSDLVDDAASVIVRTAAEGASEEELVRDVNRLTAQWADIEKKVSAGQAPQLLYGEPDLTVRIVRDLFTEDFSDLIISGNGAMNDAYDAIEAYVGHVAPHLADRLRRWDTDAEGDVFAAYRLDEQIAKALERKVFLPSGGSLVIDRTEAMTVIDVNTGKFTGSGGNLEATVTSNNLEAAEEIVRQLRLRDIGGIIVIDFIDMVLPANRELLLRRLVECLGRDRTRHQVAEITSLGLVQMTRKKIGTGLLEAFTTECPHCHGRGVEMHDMPVESQKQPDGGTRDNGRDNRRGGGRSSGGSGGGRRRSESKGESKAEPKDEPAPKPEPTQPEGEPVPVS